MTDDDNITQLHTPPPPDPTPQEVADQVDFTTLNEVLILGTTPDGDFIFFPSSSLPSVSLLMVEIARDHIVRQVIPPHED